MRLIPRAIALMRYQTNTAITKGMIIPRPALRTKINRQSAIKLMAMLEATKGAEGFRRANLDMILSQFILLCFNIPQWFYQGDSSFFVLNKKAPQNGGLSY
jgi:hypothetical protein